MPPHGAESSHPGPRRRARKASAIHLALLALTAATVVLGVLVAREVVVDGRGPRAQAAGAGAGGARAPANQPAPRVPITVDATQLPSIGIRTERVARGELSEPLRAVATLVPDERRLAHVRTRVSGWVEELLVSATGEQVRRGQPLALLFSPELVASQHELLSAIEGARAGLSDSLAQAARVRLRVLGMSAAELEVLERSGTPSRLVAVTAPRAGVILRRAVTAGAAVDPSTELYTIADLAEVWAIAEVPDADLSGIEVGSRAVLEVPGHPPRRVRVELVSPTLSERTRTAQVRFTVPNPEGTLRPGAYGTVLLTRPARRALTIFREAVVDTGQQRLVFVVGEPGHFVPRPVQLGAQLAERVEVLAGLSEGEVVVSSGVFLIDSESRLRASGGAGAGHSHGGGSRDEEGVGGSGAPAPAPDPGAPGEHRGHGG